MPRALPACPTGGRDQPVRLLRRPGAARPARPGPGNSPVRRRPKLYFLMNLIENSPPKKYPSRAGMAGGFTARYALAAYSLPMPALNDPAGPPPRLPLLPLLGFGDKAGAGDGAEWARLRALQF